jgi:hypothetical protein
VLSSRFTRGCAITALNAVSNSKRVADGRVLANRVAEVAYFLGRETNGPNLTLSPLADRRPNGK